MKLKLVASLFVVLVQQFIDANLVDSKVEDADCPAYADPNDCPVPDYSPCPRNDPNCGEKGKERRVLTADEEAARRLQISIPAEKQFEIPDDSTKLPYDLPCFSPTRSDLKTKWILWDQDDDGSVNVPLKFPFDFYGTTYTDVFVSDNGFLSFHNTFRNNYQPTSFPSGLGTPMIAPFWADAEVARNGGKGNIYYRDFGEVFAVIWDEVGYFQDGNITNPITSGAHNSFQVVFSRSSNQRLPGLNNVCFCYLDMGWSHGDRDGVNGFGVFSDATSGIRAATVGITKGLDNPFGTTTYAQIGRFNETGNTHRGIATPSGVDWLDFLGSNSPYQVNQRTGFCFNARPNLHPVFKAGPLNGTIFIPCVGQLDEYKVYFGTPEMDQTIKLKSMPQQPTPMPVGLSVTFDGGGFISDTLGIRFEWTDVDFEAYGGRSFVFEFEVCDDNVENPLCTRATVKIIVAACSQAQPCSPDLDKCVELADSQCTGSVKPVCTPFRSPDHCDPMFSFPLLVSSRYPIIRDALHGSQGDALAENGWWFHYTDDRAGAYAFTASNGVMAPELLCCVTSVDELLGSAGDPSSSLCFGSSLDWNSPFVIRAEGHHSGQGIFVLPLGLDSVGGTQRKELVSGVESVTMSQVRGYLEALQPTPKKIVIEKFVAGTGSGTTATLPAEYKFHMFNGKIGSISTFLNRGTNCQCYGEYNQDWECLHSNGCFQPSLPMGYLNPDDKQCYNIDFDKGRRSAYPMKGFDLCGVTSPPKACLFDHMKDIAKLLSKKLGVYTRIDMFVTDSNEVYVQEYTFNHMGGTRHCASQRSDSGCIDSCILGKYWQEAGGNPDMGGPLTPIVDIFNSDYGSKTDVEQCAIATQLTTPTVMKAC